MPPNLLPDKDDFRSIGKNEARDSLTRDSLKSNFTSISKSVSSRRHGRRPISYWDKLYLSGVPYRPIDIVWAARALRSIISTISGAVVVDIPFLIRTGFKINSVNHPVSWGPIYSICMTFSRASSSSTYNVAQLRTVSNVISLFVHPRMYHLSNYCVKPNVSFKVHLDTLLEPERKTLFETRMRLGLTENYQNPLDPSPEFFESFLPDSTRKEPANLPEESGILEGDGTYTLRGEWIEALEDPRELSELNVKSRSNVVMLYCHGGGHVFCSPTFHRQLVTRMLLEFGPGARAFVVDYRLAPEDPFPAAIHDAYATFLYLTQPNHDAITLCHEGSANGHPELPIDPKNIVLAGDSAGAGVAIALQLYLRDYVQPSLDTKITLPPVTVLLSSWTDISTSMPSATSMHSYCYTPSPMGVNPFLDQETFYSFPKFNFARTYLCGDSILVPNERNTAGKDVEWEWYRHLAQHPLVSPVYTADLSGLETSTLLQTGTFDRLADDTRLYAHKLGEANPNERVRLELYREMVHVHQFFEFLPMADQAIRSMVAFVEDALRERNSGSTLPRAKGSPGTEWIVVDIDGTEKEGHDDDGTPLDILEACWRPDLK
ncbi:hypothetical protein BGZ76_003600 [Entomortierella beljakovae]|nr:hypothetical protein BGZ76_003600 [Entomortierella beljakovae]